jgi:hypothetical protein
MPEANPPAVHDDQGSCHLRSDQPFPASGSVRGPWAQPGLTSGHHGQLVEELPPSLAVSGGFRFGCVNSKWPRGDGLIWPHPLGVVRC